MKNIISVLVLSIFTITLAFFANNTYKSALQYESVYTKMANNKNVENNLEQNVNKAFAGLLGALLGEQPKERNVVNKLEILKQTYKIDIVNNMSYFVATLILSMFLYFLISKMIFLVYLNVVSLISLLFGVISPIFIVFVQKELPLMGNVVLQFESNTLLSSIDKLYLQESYFVAIIIFVFSVLFPLIKTLLMIGSSFVKNDLLHTITKASSYLSKWSMTDVFVLSIFLIYLSSTKNGMIQSELEVGFYFFFTYVILSLLSSMLFKMQNESK
jgi:hypothetical protein